MKRKTINVKLILHLRVDESTTVGELLKHANVKIALGSSVFVSDVKIPCNGKENIIGLKNDDTIVLAANFKE